jgi:addiction module HigA family antidote
LEALKGERKGQHSIRINEIVKGKRAIAADTALRLGKFFGTTAQFWINLQTSFDLECAAEKIALDEIPPHAA